VHDRRRDVEGRIGEIEVRGHLRMLVPRVLSSLAVSGVQVRASQGRRGRDTGSYLDRGERSEVRA
jgi:hypothetical protein